MNIENKRRLLSISKLPGVKHIIAVSSGKGGVGKSTTAANLALALAAEGKRVGILDADIYGPSVPLLFNITGKPTTSDGYNLDPMTNYGVQVMSIGFILKEGDSMAWRGTMATQALEQLIRTTRWDNVEFLVIDMPPGTGDIQLSLSQRVPISGAVIVTTPQDIALIDVRKGITMFEKSNVPILGVVENMAVYTCPNCGHSEHIFGSDGGKEMAAELGIDLLGSLPLNKSIRQQADSGAPTVVSDPDGSIAEIYRAAARAIIEKAVKLDDITDPTKTDRPEQDVPSAD